MAELPLAEIERLLTLYRKYDGTCIFLIPCKDAPWRAAPCGAGRPASTVPLLPKAGRDA